MTGRLNERQDYCEPYPAYAFLSNPCIIWDLAIVQWDSEAIYITPRDSFDFFKDTWVVARTLDSEIFFLRLGRYPKVSLDILPNIRRIYFWQLKSLNAYSEFY